MLTILSAAIASQARRIVAPSAGGGWSPPYSLPGPGESLAIGTNDAYDIAPGGMTTTFWSYALFNNYGGGALVEDYSAGGAWAIIGGGHGVPHQTGAAVFDFADATWKRIAPSDTTNAYGNSDFAESETTGAPHYYVSGTTVPAPAHGSQSICAVPTSMGGGTNGSVAYIERTAICNESRYSDYAYAFDLATGVWSVLSGNANDRAEYEGACVLDEARNRWWHLPGNQNIYQNHRYLDAADGQWKTTANYDFAPSGVAEGSLFMFGTLLMRQGQTGGLFAWDPDDPTTNWTQLTVSGSLPSNEHNVFAYYPPNGKFYAVDQSGGTVYRLTPPAGDPFVGTWTSDTVSISPSLPSRTSDGGGPVSHYNSLFYVPSIQRLAWVPGGGESVYLVHPGS